MSLVFSKIFTKFFPSLDIINNFAMYQLINTIITKKFSQMQEYRADLDACIKFDCAKSGINALAKLEMSDTFLALFFNPYQREDSYLDKIKIKPTNFLRWLFKEGLFEMFFPTHPATEDRIEVFKKLIENKNK